MKNTHDADMINEIDDTVHTLAELTGRSTDAVWLEFVPWYVEGLHDTGLGPSTLPTDVTSLTGVAAPVLNGNRGPTDSSSTEGSVVVLAALPNPAGPDPGRETVILGNQFNSTQDLTGWKLTDDDGGSLLLSGMSIPPRGSLTVTLTESLQLGNGGDEITLRTPRNQATSVLKYGSADNGRFVFR